MAEAKLVNVKIFGIFFFFFILQIKKFRNILWVSIDPQI